MTYSIRTHLLIAASLLPACGPKDPVDSDSGSDSEPTTTSTTTTAGEPTTVAPTTTDAPDTDTGTTTTTDEPVGPIACEQLAGAPGSEVEWYLRCGGLSHEHVAGLGTDAAGNIYLGVELRTLDASAPLQIGEFEVTPGELSDILLIKLSSAGVPLWVRHFTGPLDQSINNLVFCDDGVVFTGYADAGTLDLGGGVLADNYFIASFDADGNHRWSRSVPTLGADSHVSFIAMACDAAGTLAVTGEFRNGVDLGGGPVQAPELYDGFLATFDAAGALAWARQFNSTGGDSARGHSVAFTPAGELVVVGAFAGATDLGGGPLTTDFEDDMLVTKFSAAGDHVWSQQVGDVGLQYGMAVAVDSAGRIALGGIFLQEVEIGADKYTNVFPDAVPDVHGTVYDGLLALFDPAGAPQWSKHLGTMLNDGVYDLAFASDDALLMAGFADEAFILRLFTGEEQTWQWSTDQLVYVQSALSGPDAVVVAASSYDAVDLGAGALPSRGENDFVVARIRR